MRKLDKNWLTVELNAARIELQAWPIGMKDSFAALSRRALASKEDDK